MEVQKGHILQASDDPGRNMLDSLVLVLDNDGVNATVTSGGLTHTRKVPLNELEEPRAIPSPLMRRLAYSIAGAPKRFDDLEDERHQFAEEVTRANTKLADIRKWMINQHEDGGLSREDLDGFLEEFGLEPYTKRWTGTVTITVSLSVDDAKDLEEAKEQVMDWVNKSLVDSSYEDDSDVSEVNIRSLTYNLVDLT